MNKVFTLIFALLSVSAMASNEIGLELTNSETSAKGKVVVYFDEDATANFNHDTDALKFQVKSSTAKIALLKQNVLCSIIGLPQESTSVIPFQVASAGTFELNLDLEETPSNWEYRLYNTATAEWMTAQEGMFNFINFSDEAVVYELHIEKKAELDAPIMEVKEGVKWVADAANLVLVNLPEGNNQVFIYGVDGRQMFAGQSSSQELNISREQLGRNGIIVVANENGNNTSMQFSF